MGSGRGAQKGWFADCADRLPFMLADEADAFSKQLAEDVTRVVVHGFDVAVRVPKDLVDLFRACEHADHQARKEDSVSRVERARVLYGQPGVQTYTSGVVPAQMRYIGPNSFSHFSLFALPWRNFAVFPCPFGNT